MSDMSCASVFFADSFCALTDEGYSPVVAVAAASNIETQAPDAEATYAREVRVKDG